MSSHFINWDLLWGWRAGGGTPRKEWNSLQKKETETFKHFVTGYSEYNNKFAVVVLWWEEEWEWIHPNRDWKMMINRRNTKEEEDECCRRQPLKLRTATVSLLSVVCLVAVLGSSAITGALAQQSKTAYDGAADEDLQVNSLDTVFYLYRKVKEGILFFYSWVAMSFFTFTGCILFSRFICKMRSKSDTLRLWHGSGWNCGKISLPNPFIVLGIGKFTAIVQRERDLWDTVNPIVAEQSTVCLLCPELNWRVYCKGKKNKLGMTGFWLI